MKTISTKPGTGEDIFPCGFIGVGAYGYTSRCIGFLRSRRAQRQILVYEHPRIHTTGENRDQRFRNYVVVSASGGIVTSIV
jgi:hypothetical protein